MCLFSSETWFVAYRDASMWKWPISIYQYKRQLPSWILLIYTYVHFAIDFSCNKFIPWGLNALVLRMKKDESLYDNMLSIFIRTCFSYNEDVLRGKQAFHQFVLKNYDCIWGQAEVSISVTLGYHSCQPHNPKLYRKHPLVFNYYCRQKNYIL